MRDEAKEIKLKAFLRSHPGFAGRLIIIALALAAAGSGLADSITGGAVTGGSAFTAGGTFVNLSVPWGAASTPVNTVGDANFGTPDLYAFAELQNYTLTSSLTAQVGQTSIAAGTVVNSFFVTLEPGGAGYLLLGHVNFNAPVLAIITSDGSLAASNYLGDAGITYLDPVDVGLEAGDFVTIDGSNPDQIDWNTSAATPGDSVRVILGPAPTGVPEPSALPAAGFGLLLCAASMMRRRHSVS
jgi:hypothetical protein